MRSSAVAVLQGATARVPLSGATRAASVTTVPVSPPDDAPATLDPEDRAAFRRIAHAMLDDAPYDGTFSRDGARRSPTRPKGRLSVAPVEGSRAA